MIVLILLFAGLAVALVAGYRARILGWVSLALIALGAAAFALAELAISTDYRDADGEVDCWPTCSAVQDATGVGFYGGLLVVLVGAVGLLVAAALRRRGPTA